MAEKKTNKSSLKVSETAKFHTDQLDSDANFIYPLDCPSFDIPIGGGIPSGKSIELFGVYKSGKSTLAYEFGRAFANYWKAKNKNYKILLLESEYRINKKRMNYMQLPMENLIIEEIDTIEKGESCIIENINECREKGIMLFIIWDTIAAADTNAAKKKLGKVIKMDLDDDSSKKSGGTGLQEKPKLMHSMFRNITPLLSETDTTLVLVNQVHAKIGVSFGDKTTSPGGNALRFWTSIRMKIAATGKDQEKVGLSSDTTIGIYSKITLEKNSFGPPDTQIPIYIDTEKGFDSLKSTLLFMKDNGITKLAGGTTSVSVPKGYNNDQPLKWIGEKALIELIKKPENNWVWDWFSALVYFKYAKTTPLTKINIIKKVWEYEEKFYGTRITILEEGRELDTARVSYPELKL